jgi:putative colanic acid biosynthesis UDP-glucose lipid carrier transferase
VFGHGGVLSHFIGSAAIITAIFVPIMRSRGSYAIPKLLELQWQTKAVVLVWLSTFSFLFGIVFALQIGSHFSRGAVLSFAFTGLCCLIGTRILWSTFVNHALTKGSLQGHKAILIWGDSEIDRPDGLSDLVQHGLRVEREYLYSGPHEARDIAKDVISTARNSDVEEILLVADAQRIRMLEPVIKELRALPLPVRLLPDQATAQLISLPLRRAGRVVTVEFQREPLSLIERTVKRLLDICVAGLGLVFLMPLFLIVAVAIKLDSPGPTVFRQTRWGFNGRPFTILKFRTMSVMDDGPVVQQVLRDDARLTRMGRWLRQTSMDELPQLVNVLKGDMSMVGPRPHAAAHDSYYTNLLDKYAFRHNVKPGITGWAQINGHRGATPTLESMQQRVELDLWYTNNWSFWLDIVILMRTVVKVLRDENAY